MGKQDNLTKEYMSEPEHFADAFNYYLFHGKQVIRPDSLTVLDPTEIGIVFGNSSDETVQKVRDVLKQCIVMEDDKVSYLILGIENQSEIHYAMCVKNMIYDALNYGNQISQASRNHRKDKNLKSGSEFLSGFTKEDHLKTVVTLTIYFGSDDWDAPRSLREMFEDIDEHIIECAADYKLNLIVPKEITSFSQFTTEFEIVMKYIAASADKEKLHETVKGNEFEEVDVKTVRLLNACTGSSIPVQKGEVKVNMCKTLEELKKEYAEEYAQKKTLKNAETMLKDGMDVELVAKYSSLSVEQVLELQKKLDTAI